MAACPQLPYVPCAFSRRVEDPRSEGNTMTWLRALFVTTIICGAAGLASAQPLTLTASPNPATLGQTVTLTATYTIPGSVTFFDGGTQIGTGTLSMSGSNFTATLQ